MIPSFIIMAKVIPPGIEGTMSSLFTTIININQFILKAALATFINDKYVGIDNNSID